MITSCLIAFALAGLFFFYASYNIRSGVYLRTWSRAKTRRKQIALTFDDGPHPQHTAEVLDVLMKHRAPAAFFCIGREAERHPELVRRIAEEGHVLGNHSYAHTATFPLLTTRRMTADVQQAHTLLENLTGAKVTLFRPPFGVTNPTVAAVVRRMGYQAVGWSIRSFDTRGEKHPKVFRRIVRQIAPGAVVLLHDRMPGSGQLVDDLLNYCAAQGYEVVRIDKMFNYQPNTGSQKQYRAEGT